MHWLLIAGLVGSLMSLSGIFSAYHLVFDLFSHFRIQYIVLIFGVLCLALTLRRFLIALILLCCLSVHLFDVGRAWRPSDAVADAEGPTLRVMSSNVHTSNTEYAEHIQYIRSIDPDVIVFLEYTNAWADALLSSLEEYRYRVSVPQRTHDGIALFSKLPFDESGSVVLPNTSRPIVEGVVSIAGSSLKIIGAHPPPPLSQQLYAQRNDQLQALAEVTQGETAPLVLLGDLNITPWSSHYREFVVNGALRDGRRGFGILPTWPSGFFALQIPIDHVIVNSGVQVMTLHTSEGLTSDHRSIWADLRLR